MRFARQRGLAASLVGTLPAGNDAEDFFEPYFNYSFFFVLKYCS